MIRKCLRVHLLHDVGVSPIEAWRRLAVLAMTLLLPAAAHAQSCPDPAAVTTGMDLPLAAVRYLADDALEGRMAGSPGERCAADYIVAAFRRLGIEPAGEAGSWFQNVALASVLNPHIQGTGRNVIGMLEGADPVLRAEFVVIGAHYDHLGRSSENSLAPDQAGDIHNGADDNASGVAAMLAIAQQLAAGPRPARSVLFLAFTGEESGLLGSAYFAAHPTVPLEKLTAMVNMDMVGRLGEAPLIVNGVDTAAEWKTLLEPAAERAGVALAMSGEGYGPSDHTSFYSKDIPVLHFFTNVHGDYHRPSDDWDRIDGDGIERVARIVTDVATAVANRRPILTLQRGAGEPPPPAGEATARGSGTWLGTVPDFTPVDRGVRLSGVSPGSPAEKAGMTAGDVLIGFGEHEIADLQALTDALRAHKPGDEVEIRLLRDGRDVRMRVVLGARPARQP